MAEWSAFISHCTKWTASIPWAGGNFPIASMSLNTTCLLSLFSLSVSPSRYLLPPPPSTQSHFTGNSTACRYIITNLQIMSPLSFLLSLNNLSKTSWVTFASVCCQSRFFLHLVLKEQVKKLCFPMIRMTGLIKCEHAPSESVYITQCSAIWASPPSNIAGTETCHTRFLSLLFSSHVEKLHILACCIRIFITLYHVIINSPMQKSKAHHMIWLVSVKM